MVTWGDTPAGGFSTNYMMPMDREFEHHAHADCGHDHGSPSEGSTNDVGVGIKDLGVSAAFGPVPNVAAMGAKVRGGAKTLEIGFFGYGKGSGQGQTPGTFGKVQRQAMREIGKANEVNFTTHTSVGVYGLAGMDQQGNFNKQSKEMNIQEIRRAVEFAADVGQGGPVVVHTGEFQRPVVDADWNEKGEFAGKFKMYEDEEGRTAFRVVDSRTGGLISEARKNKHVARPVWLQAAHDYTYMDEHGKTVYVSKGDYIDYFDRKVDRAHRVPEFDDKTQGFKTDYLTWDELKKEAGQMTDEAKEAYQEWKKADKAKKEELEKKSPWGRFFKEGISDDQIKVRPEEAYIIATLETNAAHSRGWALNYGGDFKETIESIKKLEKAKPIFEERLRNAKTEQEKAALKRQFRELIPGMIPGEPKLETEIIEQVLNDYKRRLRQSQEAAASQWAQAAEAVETMRHVQSAETYALNEAYDAYAQAGIAAMKHTQVLEEKGQLKKPITVALENLFPESYGAHPEELIKLVKDSRARMAQKLIQDNKISEKEAWEKAQQHITATFDTGHLNMWRKYWRGDPNNTIEQNDKAFNEWTLKMVDKMSKAGVIGHVHLDDNYGYQDEHLAPGEGNTPIKEMVAVLKKNGYKGELIIEPGADYSQDVSGFHSVMKTWKLFGSPVYGAASGFMERRTWGQVGYGFFGSTQPPYFTFGAYSPSEDWTLWSGVPLE